ncbi:MAG: hypothetical protein LAO76_26365 [Acidobacteriia bacterium]|nr:hypothetical protein [Terriglobia bacterium]
MPTLTDDLQAVLSLKATHFKGKTYTAWSDTDLAAYQQTRTLPEKKRAAAVLEQWDDYLNDHLAPLVREAVPEAINLSKQTCPNSVSERKCFVESCLSDWIIGPASDHTRWWFMVACEGSSVVMDAARTKGPTWKESIDAWAIPHWMNPYAKLEDGAALFIRDRQNVLRERLEYVLREEIGALADRLLIAGPGYSATVPDERPKVRAGRPATPEAIKARLRELRSSGGEWKEVAAALDAETGTTRTVSAYRNMLRVRKTR